jgi:hypothetical protein
VNVRKLINYAFLRKQDSASHKDSILHIFIRGLWSLIYELTVAFLFPINFFLSRVRRDIVYKNSVLHVSYMVHIPYYMVKILRKFGVDADYLAIGTSQIWDKCDFKKPTSRWPHVQALQEFFFFWRVVARYKIIHLHFSTTMSISGWELLFLKKMGRIIVIHYRGCEIRDREKNMSLHPEINICQECDYDASICKNKVMRRKIWLGKKYGDFFLITTPDLKEFAPTAEHFPFLTPEINCEDSSLQKKIHIGKDIIKIVHVTAHPGIEGTKYIQTAINNLRDKGYKIDFVFLSGVHNDRVLHAYKDADLSIGKLKMGYYANSQIESMFFGVPAITYVRPEFMNNELESSGFIFSTIEELEKTLEYYLTHPEQLESKRKIARVSILRLHDNEKLARRLIDLYARIGS